ncbi:MAG: 4Fe-4S binding protein [Bacteroidales bacterium]|nr:4Fe-4S binding protein [Bacteroidales bacterium]
MLEKKLLRTNSALLLAALLATASSIQLECLHGQAFCGIANAVWVWIHVFVCVCFLTLSAHHLHLHLRARRHAANKRGHGRRVTSTRLLAAAFLVVLLTGLVAVGHFVGGGHTTIGGVHGKLGFVALFLLIGHVCRRRHWFRGRRCGTSFSPTVDPARCVGCGMCVKRCPAQVFDLENRRATVVRPAFCLQCHHCVEKCPRGAIS